MPPPPPRRGWVKQAVIGALGIFLLLVAVSSVAAAAAFRLGSKRAARAPEPAPSASTVTSSVAPPPEAPAPSEPDAPEPVADLGSPEASLRARPSWGRFRDHSGSATDDYAPQPSKPLDVFLAATPMHGPLDHGFVICRFQSFNKADTFAGDDLHVRATFGAMPEVASDGPEDGNLGFASAPLVSLKRGETMRFEVYDRDVFGMTLLSRPSVRYEAGPFVTADTGAAIECRQLADTALGHTLRATIARADRVVGALAATKLDGQDPDWGYPNGEIAETQRAIGDVAALVGWADARVAKRIESLDSAIARVEGQRGAVFASLHAGAGSTASFADMDVTLGDVDCHARSCTVHLSVKNRGKEDVRFGSFMGPRVYVADASSGPVTASVSGTVAAQSTSEIVVFDAPIGSGPAIVGVCGRAHAYRERCAALKIR